MTSQELSEPMHEAALVLANDLCNYIDWTLYWPSFVQSVRAMKNGSLALDVRYIEEKEEEKEEKPKA